MHIGLQVKCPPPKPPLFLSGFNEKLKISRQIFEGGKKCLHQILRIPVQCEQSCSMRADGRNEINGRYSQICECAHRHVRLTQKSIFHQPGCKRSKYFALNNYAFKKKKKESGCGLNDPGFESRDRDKKFFSSHERPEPLWMPHPASYSILTRTFAG